MIKKFKDLTDEQLRGMDLLDMRNAYVELREHHIDETIKLYAKVAALREENKKLTGSMFTQEEYQQLIVSLASPSGSFDDVDKLFKLFKAVAKTTGKPVITKSVKTCGACGGSLQPPHYCSGEL